MKDMPCGQTDDVNRTVSGGSSVPGHITVTLGVISRVAVLWYSGHHVQVGGIVFGTSGGENLGVLWTSAITWCLLFIGDDTTDKVWMSCIQVVH